MLLTILACVLLFPKGIKASNSQRPDERITCAPEGQLTTTECEARGCIFEAVDNADIPWCFFPPDVGYVVDNINRDHKITEVKLSRNKKYRY